MLWADLVMACVSLLGFLGARRYMQSCVADEAKNRLSEIDGEVHEKAVALVRLGKYDSVRRLLGREAKLSSCEAIATLAALRREVEGL